VPWIAAIVPHDAAWQRAERLGLVSVFDEIGRILTGFTLLLREKTDANSGAEVRKVLDQRFQNAGGWVKEERRTGDIDWIKRLTVDGVTVAVGVELQVSGRGGGSHLTDIIHLRAGVAEPDDGRIDIAVMVVPTDRLARYLTDRVEGLTQVRKYLKQMKADEDLPLILVAIDHDGPGPALPKRPKRRTGSPKGRFTYPTQ
jgi:hypothetical protein